MAAFSPSPRARLLRSLVLTALAAVPAFEAPARAADERFDIIVRNGVIVDGSGAPRFAADVGIRDGRIAAVRPLASASGAIEIEARGLFVAPGFINIHSHATPEGLRTAQNMLTQGVTTEILNADGGGPVDLKDQLASLSAAGLAVNVGANIGFNSVWASVNGPADQRPDKAALERMRGLVLRGLEQGAWGVSAGLDYKPGYFATALEVKGVVGVAKPWRTIFTNHERLTPESGYSSKSGIAETIAIGEQTGLAPVITHMKAQGLEQKTAPALLAMMNVATARGAYTAADVYPYLAGQSGLAALIIPGWALDGGRDAMLERFKDPALRAQIIGESERAMNARFGGPQGVYATGHETELTDAMKRFEAGAGETLIRLLEKDDGGAILRFGVESDLVAILQHPSASVACDCGAIAESSRVAHPRYFGSFPRVLGRYVREQKALSFEEAIRKMTGLPASTIGMVDRGLIAVGMAADLTVFDPETIVDRATFAAPTEHSVGVRHVIVNGQMALRDGVALASHAGRALVRTSHEPSRPQAISGERRVRVRATMGELRVSIDVRQASPSSAPRGRVSINDRTSRTETVLTEIGAFQTAPGWAALTGMGRASGVEQALTIIIEAADPLGEATPPVLIVSGRAGVTLSRALPRDSVRVTSGH